MSENWTVFRIEELKTVAFVCEFCTTETTFGAEAEILNRSERVCPGCTKVLPMAAEILAAYKKLYQIGKNTLLKARA